MFGHFLLRLKNPQPAGEPACHRRQAGRGEGECVLVYHKEKAQQRRFFSIFYLKTEIFPVSEILRILSPRKKGNIPKKLDGLQNLIRSSGATYFCLLSDLPVHRTK
jgi:hypothetical protein